MTVPRKSRDPWALSGVLFAALFIVGLILGGVLASAPFPMPGAPATEVARYYEENPIAVLTSGSLQILSAVALFVFVTRVVAFVRGINGEKGTMSAMILGGGALAGAFLLMSALLSWTLVLVAEGGELSLIRPLRNLNFLTGGAAHVVSVGVFAGAASISILKNRVLPGWIPWLGIVAATLSLLSLASLAWFPATVFIPLGRLLAFVWSTAVGLLLALGRQSETPAGS